MLRAPQQLMLHVLEVAACGRHAPSGAHEDVSEPYWRNWSVLSQVLITVIFMLIAFLALYGSALRGVQTQGHSTAGQTQTNRTRADRDPKSNSHIIAPGSGIWPLAFDELAGALGGAHDGFDERDAQTHLTAEQV